MGLTTPEAQASVMHTFEQLHQQGFDAPQMPYQLPLQRPSVLIPAVPANRRGNHQYLGPPSPSSPFPPAAWPSRSSLPGYEAAFIRQPLMLEMGSPSEIERLIQERVRLMSTGYPDRGPDSLPRSGSNRGHSKNEAAFSAASATQEARVIRHLYNTLMIHSEFKYMKLPINVQEFAPLLLHGHISEATEVLKNHKLNKKREET